MAEANSDTTAGVDWLPLSPGTVTIYILISDADPADSNVTNNLAMPELEVADSHAKVQLPIILR